MKRFASVVMCCLAVWIISWRTNMGTVTSIRVDSYVVNHDGVTGFMGRKGQSSEEVVFIPHENLVSVVKK